MKFWSILIKINSLTGKFQGSLPEVKNINIAEQVFAERLFIIKLLQAYISNKHVQKFKTISCTFKSGTVFGRRH